MRALVLAAGLGKRLAPLTEERPKGLLELGGRSLLARLLDGLSAAGVRETAVVVGYRQEQIRAHLGGAHRGMPVRYLENPEYARGPLLSLWTGRGEFEQDEVVLADGDVLFAPALLEQVIRSPEPNVFLAEPDFVDTGEEQNLYLSFGGGLRPPVSAPGAVLAPRSSRATPPGATALAAKPRPSPVHLGRDALGLAASRPSRPSGGEGAGPASPPDPENQPDWSGSRVVALRRGVMGPPEASFDARAEWVGFVKVGRAAGVELAATLDAFVRQGRSEGDYERALDGLLPRHRFGVCPTGGLPWIEIDFPQDLQAAETEILPRIQRLGLP